MENVSINFNLHTLKKILIIYIIFYLAYYNFSSMADWMPLYKIFSPIMLPRIFRIFEMLFLFMLYYFFSLYNKQNNKFTILLFIFITLQITRILISSDFFIIPYRLLSIFSNFGHFLFFFTLINLPFEKKDLDRIILFYWRYLVFNILLTLLIIYPLYNFQREDILNGTYIDSHIFGVYLYITSCYFFYKWSSTNKLKFILYSLLFLILQYFPSNEKIILLNIIMYFFIYIITKRLKLITIIISIVLSIFSLILILYIGEKFGGLRIGRILKLFSEQDLGFILSWPLLFSKINSPLEIIFGLGPGMYAGQGAQQLYKLGYNLPLYDIFKLQFDNVYFNSAFQILWNRLTILWGEYGILGMFLYIYFTYYLIMLVKESNYIVNEYKIIFFSGLAAIVFQDIINDNGLVQMLIFSLMSIPALAYRFNNKNKKKCEKENINYS